MSAANESEPTTVRCANCGSVGLKHQYLFGDYCSRRCYYQSEGQGLIARVSNDPHFCSTCYDQLRDIEPAPEHKTPGPDYAPRVTCPACFERFIPDGYDDPHADCPACDHGFDYVRLFIPGPKNIADGVQYAKAALTHGVDADEGTHGYYEFQRESCSCGAVDPNATTAELQRADLDTVRENLFVAVRWLTWTDDDLPPASRARYDDSLAERPYDAALAVGKAVYGGEDREV